MSGPLPSIDEAKEAFAFFDDWEDRYRYIMDLGEKLPVMCETDRVEANLVHGCQSLVWVAMHQAGGRVALGADSDSSLVKGLAALVVLGAGGARHEALAVQWAQRGLLEDSARYGPRGT